MKTNKENQANMAVRYEHEIPDGYEARIDGNKVIIERKDSEDERVRKELIEEIEFIIPHDDETDSEGLILPSYRARIDRYKSYLEKQKEQKSEIKYVYPKFRKGDVIEPITPNGHCMPVRVLDIWNGSYSCRSDDDKAYLSLPIRNEDEYRLAEQKPAEWSKEDEALIENVCTALKGYALHERKVDLDEHAHRLEEMSERLKSLRPQPHWKSSEEQPKPTCKTCGFYENNCPFIRGKFIQYPNKVCKDYTYSVIKEQPEVDLDALVDEAFDKYSSVDGYGQLSASFNRAELYSFIKKIARKEG